MMNRHVNSMMNIASAALDVCRILNGAHFIAYFAGGYVRDMLLEKNSSDIDIATDALPSEVCSLFPKTILVGAAFGVVVVIHEGYQFEVATFRQDSEYTDGRKPTTVLLKSSAEEDAKRRDFTVNGMFFDPINKQVLDFVGGREDIEKSSFVQLAIHLYVFKKIGSECYELYDLSIPSDLNWITKPKMRLKK